VFIAVFLLGLFLVVFASTLAAAKGRNGQTATVLVRNYKGTAVFAADANKLAGQGWMVQTQSSRRDLLGLTSITVTYTRAA
jgi:hypothetical protein